jgi:O-antigen ligase
VREKIVEILKKAVWGGIVLTLFLRCIIEFWLLRFIDINDFVQIRLIEGRANHIIESIIFFTFFLFVIQRFLEKKSFQFDLSLDGSLLGFISLSLISFAYTINIQTSLQAFQELISLTFLFYMVSIIALNKRIYKDFICLLVIIAVGISLYGIRQYYVIFPFLESSGMLDNVTGIGKSMVTLRRVSSVFGWPNKLAGFLGICIPVAIGMILAHFSVVKSKAEVNHVSKTAKHTLLLRLLLFIASFILFLCMFFTYSIGGWLSLLFALIIEGILIVTIIGKKNIKELFFSKKILSGVVSTSIIIIFICLIGITFQKRMGAVTASATSARISYIKGTLIVIKDNPILGAGIGNFKTAYGRYVPSGKDATKHAHNSYLELWADIGIAGLLLFLLFTFQLLRRGVHIINDIKDREDKLLITSLFSGVCVFLIHNIMEFTFYVHSVALYWWFIAGLLTSRIRMKNN